METSESGGKPHNLDLSSLEPLPEKKEVGSGVKKPETPVTENPSDKPKAPKRSPNRRLRGVFS
jgi:hypothetical protein